MTQHAKVRCMVTTAYCVRDVDAHSQAASELPNIIRQIEKRTERCMEWTTTWLRQQRRRMFQETRKETAQLRLSPRNDTRLANTVGSVMFTGPDMSVRLRGGNTA